MGKGNRIIKLFIIGYLSILVIVLASGCSNTKFYDTTITHKFSHVFIGDNIVDLSSGSLLNVTISLQNVQDNIVSIHNKALKSPHKLMESEIIDGVAIFEVAYPIGKDTKSLTLYEIVRNKDGSYNFTMSVSRNWRGSRR